jgi:hypothetical protein
LSVRLGIMDCRVKPGNDRGEADAEIHVGTALCAFAYPTFACGSFARDMEI